MKTIALLLAALAAFLPLQAQAQTTADFGGTKAPYDASVTVKGVDFETTQNLDFALPANFRYAVQGVVTVVTTAPSAVTTAPRIGVSEYDGSTATIIHGTVAAEANAVGEMDEVFAPSSGNGYFYTEDVAASSTTGLCTQNTSLNTPGALAGVTSPLHPRKVVLTLVDNAGADLAGTVTLVGKDAQGKSITEVITVTAGTVSYTTTNAFSVLTSGSHDFGATGEATNDTLNLGRSVQVALPHKNARVFKALTAGVADTVAAEDVAAGTYALTDVPDGATEQEVYYTYSNVPYVLTGGNSARVVITAGTVTGSDIRDVTLLLRKY